MLVRGFRVTYTAITNRWKLGKQPSKTHWLDYAKETVSTNQSETVAIQHTNQFIDDLKKTFHACRIFIFFPFFWICYLQVSGNLTSQAAQMNVGKFKSREK
jgi:dipeptide/tripeptide permease